MLSLYSSRIDARKVRYWCIEVQAQGGVSYRYRSRFLQAQGAVSYRYRSRFLQVQEAVSNRYRELFPTGTGSRFLQVQSPISYRGREVFPTSKRAVSNRYSEPFPTGTASCFPQLGKYTETHCVLQFVLFIYIFFTSFAKTMSLIYKCWYAGDANENYIYLSLCFSIARLINTSLSCAE